MVMPGLVQHVIDGAGQPAASGETFVTYDPSTGEPITEVARGNAADVAAAVEAARRALGPWRAEDPMVRTRLLLRLADLIETHADELAELESRDVGKPVADLLGKELPTAVGSWIYHAGWPTKLHGTTNPAPAGVFSYTLREPVGVVGVITPWNFPLVISSWKLAPALACGNTVVHKPSEHSPLSAVRFAQLALEAGLPAGVVNVVTGDGEAGAALAAHDGVDKVSFTGSTATGQAIHRAASGNLKRLTLELGGKSANIVFDDADVNAALGGAMRATFRNAGQVCTAGSRLIVASGVADQLVTRLADKVSQLRVGPTTEPGIDVGPLVSAGQRDHVVELYDSARADGAQILVGGGAAVVESAPNGYFVQPSVFTGTTNEMRINREEIFGPAVAVIQVDDEDEAVALANDSDYGLAAGVWTRDMARAHRVVQALDVGTVWVNMYGGLDPYAAYGGRRLSGYGYEQGPETIDEYTTRKTVRQATGG